MSLSLRGLHKRYGSLHVLDGIDLDVGHQEIVTILGPSGCGKTTLLRIVNGLIPHEEGEVIFRSERVTAPRPEMAMVFQHFGLFPWKRLYQNISYGLRIQGRPAGETDRLVRRYIGLVGLEGFEEHYPSELSGGMQQRAGLARALATQAAVLLLDEPFGALDALTREQLQEELLRIIDVEPKSMLFITHSIDEALLLGDRVVVMSPRPGRIRFELETGFGRGREIESLRASDRFQALRHYLWEALRRPDADPGPLPDGVALRMEAKP
ncbi:MAG: ABC transporter ATP-binding protein [Candidatus Tectomicrobia bacterium]|uniref:ABC transporter ATP-binding protein n=1 Tax=Tectimicrobiota bacterium TaxID=2528274 RepID=A0A932I4B7_UNCTE|nr:ABC transporter ATP-binding protein [Candidatus Tectomicrobia bacterium]